MAALLPTASERASLEFTVPKLPFWGRYIASAALIVIGTAIYFGGQSDVFYGRPNYGGLILVLLGHLPLWVRKQRLAPGGATPLHEDNWIPVEPDWYERVRALEKAGADWDTTPWDVTNKTGCGVMVLAVFGIFVGGMFVAVLSARWGYFGGLAPVVVYAVVLFLPLWWNGRRNNWHPSELRLKGKALQQAVALVPGKAWDVVPLLALRESPRGHYPVDARVMLRPRATKQGESIDERFIGIQVQVSMNAVRGVRYPYLYAVVLGKRPFRFGRLPSPVGMVVEEEDRDDVSYVVIRQWADNSGGWHTDERAVRDIMDVALLLGERCR